MNAQPPENQRARQEVTLRVAEEVDCPLFRKGDKMVVRLPEVDTASGNVCAHVIAQALPFMMAAARSGQDIQSVLPRLRCISGGEHFAAPVVERIVK